MVNVEQSFNSFQIIRPVIETESLKRFLQAADELAKAAFQGESFVLLSTEDAENENIKRLSQVPVHEIYSSKRLRLPELDRRSPRGRNNQAYFRAFNRFSIPEKPTVNIKTGKRKDAIESLMPYKAMREAGYAHDITDNRLLNLEFNSIAIVEDLSEPSSGYELALIPNSSQPETLLLIDEMRLFHEALADRFPDIAYPASKTAPKVSFMRTPSEFNSSENLISFVELMQDFIPIRIQLGEVKPIFNI